MDQYILILQSVMQNDAVLSVNPMTFAVYTPSQILGTFNAVAYQKSGSVIRMMQHFLTPEVFRKGLALYLKTNSRKAAAPSDLYVALQQALDESNHTIPYTLSTVLDRWTTQGGFPVLNVVRSAPTAESIIVSQERFLTDSSLSSDDRWHVPINWVLSSNIDFSDTAPQAWIPPSFPAVSRNIPGLSQAEWFIINKQQTGKTIIEFSNTAPQAWIPPSFPAVSRNIPGLSQAEWFIINKQQTGYYRVNYEESNWAALAKKLNEEHQDIHVLNRAQIVDDSFNLARNGRLNYTLPFEISRYLVKEKDYIPWGSVNNAFSYLSVVLSGTDVYELYQKYLLELSAPLYSELGFEVIPGEEFVTPYHRNIILNINCENGNQDCVDEAQRLLQNYRENPNNRLNPDIQNTVFCSGLRGGDRDSFDFLWEQYIASTDASEQSTLLSSLGCTPDEELLDSFLKQVIDDNSPVREQDKHSVIVAVINSSPRNMDIALDFVLEHFHEIQPRVQGLTGTTNILNAFARRLNSQEHSDKMDQFEARHGAIFSAGEMAAVAAIRENIGASITWTNENLATVAAWLQENYGDSEPDSANAVTSSLVVFLSVLCAYLYR
ncbi:peptidase family m1 domain-containing protein [Phthorimaea operculella]|nr:peptidase family m1 domain-containing protein [Phthorimaea operculella]